MPDINEWRLEYPGASIDFGNYASGYPLASQVEIEDDDAVTQDGAHPNSDGGVMGIDTLGGFQIVFNATILGGNGSAKWNSPLDRFSTIKSRWRADTIRKVPGSYATLINKERNKVVYGRPRKIAQNLEMMRKGVVGFVATFKTNSPDWYSLTEKSVLLSLIQPSSFGIASPITAPFYTFSTESVDQQVDNDGDIDTWPVIVLKGPGVGWSLELLVGTLSVWKFTIGRRLAFDEEIRIDTRPWARSVTLNGEPANGLLRGESLTNMRLPVGRFRFRFRATSDSGTATAKVYWRDAYASL